MVQRPPKSILICTTPRSGSTLLCSLLLSSGVAGNPESWFRHEDRAAYAEEWKVDRNDFPAFLAAAIRQGRGANQTFACRLMYDTQQELLKELQSAFGPHTDPELLAHAFGQADFVFLERSNKVAQAISYYRAASGGLWHRNADGSILEATSALNSEPPEYDYDAINTYLNIVKTDARLWRDWFTLHDIAPIKINYEDLSQNPEGAATDLLTRLERSPTAPIRIGTARLADELNLAWETRFKDDQSLKQNSDAS
ncbi:Stf0 family sulfotransferase [Alisedimentitalea sp. MJ-SS2]|uniref:Stf0 family sulfotransferase n=1 Tax=Aliisedimentitalea sp. MJ-SS2 TaxID=3049795 RepID=UPI0029111CC7|nr:Stf0 family sulfotransferase [Alisedimentitalea sp. MJ-SS2]MDU8927464.1 Stf0 family sulfotransferase [Alisedimentitalea sp. MJ-SS2]